MDIFQAARTLRPGTAWTLRGDVLTQAEDGTPRVVVPGRDELQQVMASDAYSEARARDYPSVGDQLDALWKGGADLDTMRAKIQAVKDKYPKPVDTPKGASHV